MIRRVATAAAATAPARAAFSGLRRLLRRYRPPFGYERIALSKPVGFFTLAEPSVVTTLRNGRRIRVRTDDHVGRVLHVMGDFQPKVSW